jgi:cytoskeletal protein CcmA (bactofilin family)
VIATNLFSFRTSKHRRKFNKENVMSKTYKALSIMILLALLALIATPVYAFDGRSGDKVVVQAGDVVNDDLYVGANQFVLDGTVNGDVIAGGQMITINGTINGDLIAAGQTIVINGTVTGAARIAASVLFVGEKASIGKDVIGAGYSLETRKGSAVARDLVFAGGQILMAGNVARNMQVATGGLDIAGNVGGDVNAEVGDPSQSQAGPPPTMFMGPSTVPVPFVNPGLTVDPSAKISGNLQYTQTKDLTFPAGVIGGKITRTPQPQSQTSRLEETPSQKVANWSLNSLRSLVTLILIGLLLLWLVPMLVKKPMEKLESKVWQSLGWGAVSYGVFFFSIIVILFVMIVGGILFGLLTLGGLSGTIIWLGILALFALVVGFVLVTSFVAKVVFGMALGKWILTRLNSPLAENKFWPMVIGVAITVIVVEVLSFPLIPGILGWLLNLAVVLFGLGAVWLWGREALAKKSISS